MAELQPPPKWPFAALSVPIATDTRELSVVLLGTNANPTARQSIQFTQPVQIVGFHAEVNRWSFIGAPNLVATIGDIAVQIDLDDKSFFSAQENNQVQQGKWVSLGSQILNPGFLRLIQPRNRTPVFGLSFRWKVPPTATALTRVFEDALISFSALVNYPEGL